jgi:UDP-N-acetylmuramoyl-tripeptide--D-alanyl-D-alanine ligase
MKRNLIRMSEQFHRYRAILEWGLRDRIKHYRARLHRMRLSDVTFVAITGSAGKTTTKDLASAVLARRGRTHKSHGTANQHAYLDDTVRGVTPYDKYSVLEVSADRPGYLDRPLRLIRPRISVITLIAREHFSAYRSLEAIAKEKGKLVTALPLDGVAVLNIDDPFVRAVGEQHGGRIVWVGRDEAADVRLLECSSKWPQTLTLRLSCQGRVFDVPTRMYGKHLAMPVALAIGVGVAAAVPLEEAIAAVSAAEPVEGRMQLEVAADGVAFLRDDWKAPQWSLHAPFDFMKDADADRKIIVLGSISDSPKSPAQRYAHAAREALEVADLVVLVGVTPSSGRKLKHPKAESALRAFVSIKDAAEFLQQELRRGDLVLLKGTNKQDHLVRLVMNRRQSVRCWLSDCGIPRFCASCERLYGPSSASPEHAEREPAFLPALPFSRSPLVVGLGNPGARYRNTPHNMGYRAVESIAVSAPGSWVKQAEGLARTLDSGDRALTLFKPSASMNTCGPLASSFVARTGRTPQDCIVVYDDMDLPLGEVRVTKSGGDGGHKGVRSLMVALGTNAFVRVRIGARRPDDVRSASKVVLSEFSSEDEPVLRAAFARAESEILRMTHKMSNEQREVRDAAKA